MKPSPPLRPSVAAAVTTLFIALLALCGGVGLQPAQALTLVPLSVEEMAQSADRVIYVRTIDTQATRRGPASTSGARGTIETSVRLEVLENLKGGPSTEHTLVVPGGTVGGLTLVDDGQPAFKAGETCILFLDGEGRVVGGPQGKLAVVDGTVPALGVSATDALGLVAGEVGGSVSWRAAPMVPLPAPVDRVGPAPVGGQLGGRPDGLAVASTVDLFGDGFELGLGAWSVFGSPTWGGTAYRAYTGTRAAYSVGSSIGAPGPYLDNSDAWMVAGPFDLSGATSAVLEYEQYLSTELDYDWCYSLVSLDGESFWGSGWSGSSGGWFHRAFNLSSVPDGSGGFLNFAGQPAVWVAFYFVSDGSVTGEGAYVDDVRLSAETGPPPPAPVISGIDPSSSSAGTGSQVTVTGTGFGDTQGSGRVDFFYRSGSPSMPAPIVSWSDTAIVCVVPTAFMGGYPGSAGSGPVTVTSSSGQTSNGYDFHVTFAYGGTRWPAPTCPYKVNPNTGDTAAEEALFDAGASSWDPASSFTFVDEGASAVTSPTLDYENHAFWTSDLAAGVLAQNSYWFTGSTIVDSDIAFNDDYLWGDGSGGSYDIQSIATHELGHSLSLRDLYGVGDEGKVMYGFGSPGVQKREIHPDDAAGARWIYGPRQVTLSTGTAGSGTITRSPDQARYDVGATVSLTAIPDSGWDFVGWSGDVTSSENPVTFTIYDDMSVTAVFSGSSLALQPGWNLVAAGPGTEFGEVLFGWDGTSYGSATDPVAWKGYWVRATSARSVTVQTVPGPHTIALLPGWNLIGNPMADPAELTLPAGVVAFAYDPVARSYLSTLILLPGQGAWVRARAGDSATLAPLDP